MKQVLIFILLLLPLCYGEPDFLLLEQKKIGEIDEIENEHNSNKRGIEQSVVSDDFFPGATKYYLEFPVVYERIDKDFSPNAVVQYYYTASDSKIRLIVYDWDKSQIIKEYSELQKELKNESQRIDEYSEKYKKIYQSIVSELGDPVSGHGETITVKKENSSYIERNAKWIRNNCTVVLNMIFSTDNRQMGTYRIRTKVYWD